jgi:toxin FitB
MKLIDSNIIIYSANHDFSYLRELFHKDEFAITSATMIEVLGYNKLDEQSRIYFESIFKIAEMIDLKQGIVLRAINLKQHKKLSLGDSIAAATALIFNWELYTHNTNDFKHIKELKLADPVREF